MTESKLVWSAEELAATGFNYQHPLDDRSEIVITGLSRLTGMARSALNLTRIAPGKRAFPIHRHHAAEEWVYVIAGTAEVLMDETTHVVGAGGFVVFPPGGPAHAVQNPSDGDELVCLMGGNTVETEIVDFPELGKRLNRSGAKVELAEAAGFAPFDFFSKTPLPGPRS